MIQEVHFESAKSTGLKILIVDDELIVRRSLSKVLITKGHDVEVVATAEAAINKLQNNDYNLIILDVKLPGLSGIELYKSLEETRPSLVRRVVFITGDVIGQDTLDFFSESKVSYLTKPFHIEDVEKAIRNVMSQHR